VINFLVEMCDMAVYTKTSVPAGAFTLPREAYISHDVFATELQRIFAQRWLCVGREEQIPKAGEYFLANVGQESLIVVRGGDDRVRALYNVCRHRGTRMCTEESGKFTGSIMCPYHAWTYGLDGKLMAARIMDGVPGFDKADYPLKQAAVASWEGFVFINMSDRPEPFEVTHAPLLGRFARWHISELRVAKTIVYDLHCNWKLIVQNYSECYHCPLVHPALDKLTPFDSGRNDLGEGPYLGGYMTMRVSGSRMSMSGKAHYPPLGEVTGEELDRVYYYALFPNMLLSLEPDYVMVHRITPVAVDRSIVTCQWLFDPKTIATPGFDPSDAVDFWDMTNRQDWHVCELSQLGVQSKAYAPGPYANQEGLLYQFDRYYRSVMESRP
jgi:Rieske 2Fe-2S family protein